MFSVVAVIIILCCPMNAVTTEKYAAQSKQTPKRVKERIIKNVDAVRMKIGEMTVPSDEKINYQTKKGRLYPSEMKIFRDERTGAKITQITDYPSINHNLYFITPSSTFDDKTYLFISNRSGSYNIFAADAETGVITQLTDCARLSVYSVVAATNTRECYFVAGNEVRAVNVDTLNERLLARFDGPASGLDINTKGTLLVTSITKDSQQTIMLVHTDGTGSEEIYTPPRSSMIYQFCPIDDNIIEYADGIDQRMWILKVKQKKEYPLYLHDRNQWITHESWLGGTDKMIFTHWPYALKIIDKDEQKASILAKFNVWHASSRKDGSLIVCDTTCPDIGLQLIDPKTGKHKTLCYPNSSNAGTQWKFDTPATGKTNKYTYGPQWTHPHPSFTSNGKKVVYTSDCTGHSQVYVVDVPEKIEF